MIFGYIPKLSFIISFLPWIQRIAAENGKSCEHWINDVAIDIKFDNLIRHRYLDANISHIPENAFLCDNLTAGTSVGVSIVTDRHQAKSR